ncbi:hypothetical protein ACTFIZ_012879 [Dictyostelium cf. discoideum]
MFLQPQKDNGTTCQTWFKLNLEKSVLQPTQSITFLGLQIDSLSMKLLVPKEEKCNQRNKKLFKARLLLPKKTCCFKRKANRSERCSHPIQTLTRRTNKFHSQCLTLANGDWDQSFPIPQEVKLEI